MISLAVAVLQSGGPGSGCHGDNCGRKPSGEVFVSPNTKENTHVDYPLKALSKKPHRDFTAKAATVVHTITAKPPVLYNAVGVWKDGAENSTEIQLHTDRDKQRYIAALLGKSANQKAVLHWEPNAKGAHALYQIYAQNRDVRDLHNKLSAAGI